MATHPASTVADMIGKTENWVKRNAANLPHHRFGKTIVFTDDDIAAILALGERRPGAEDTSDDDLAPKGGRRR